ncbi:MAG: hypothetical protein C4517_07005 [Stygiobacter sp.]|nr:MAG: hypothetical protein C4517_07005 [Stygiobacter sp.]
MQSNDLIDFMNSATRQIGEEYDRIQKRATEDPGTDGDQGEENWATLLRNWLPTTFQIVTKGRILSHKGIASPQVDVLVLQPEYPTHLLDKKLYLAGGVLAAFECKVTLKAKHIVDFIKNSIDIKSHLETRKGTPYKELQSPIIYGLLAHSHTWKGNDSKPEENIRNSLIEADNSLITHPIQMPDIICVADLACWSSSKMVFIGPSQIPNWTTLVSTYGEKGSATSAYIGHTKVMEQQTEIFTPIGAMITSLLNKLGWEYPNLRQLSRYFTLTNIQGSGKGYMRKWESKIYSDEIRTKVEMGQLKNGVLWDEWSINIQ